MTDIAIAHKDYDVRGGGERVAEALAQTFHCPLYVGIGLNDNSPDDDVADVREIETTGYVRRGINRGGIARKIGLTLLWRHDAKELYDYDTIITSGAQPRWFKPRDDQTLISYTHTTPRSRTDRWHQREFGGAKNRLSALVSDAFEIYYRPNVNRPDVFVCNSDIVARRLKKYWGVSDDRIEVVYPPVDTSLYDRKHAKTEDYYFSVSRLHPLKRYDEVIEAFQGTDREIKIAGRGPEQDKLEEMAAGHDNIELLGHISEREKLRRLAEAKAFVFNAEREDFGIAPVEAMASGTPVIGVREGFTQHQVLSRKNGYTYRRGRLVGALRFFEGAGVDWSDEQIAEFAHRNFGLERFQDEMRRIVDEQREQNRVDPDYEYPPIQVNNGE